MNHRDDVAILRHQGHRITPQRLTVIEIIKGSGRHLTADAIYDAVRARHPYVNIATIYRTLQWLQDIGLVAPIALGDGPLHYEYVHGVEHHHLICQECGGEQEIGDDILDALKQLLLERYGFAAQLNHLGLPGRCVACRQAAQGGVTMREEGS